MYLEKYTMYLYPKPYISFSLYVPHKYMYKYWLDIIFIILLYKTARLLKI